MLALAAAFASVSTIGVALLFGRLAAVAFVAGSLVVAILFGAMILARRGRPAMLAGLAGLARDLVEAADAPAAALGRDGQFLAANADWTALVGMVGPSALGLAAGAKVPPVVLGEEGRTWRPRVRSVAGGRLFLWTLVPAGASEPLRAAIAAAGLGWVEIAEGGAILAAGGSLDGVATPGAPLDDALEPLDKGGVRRRARRGEGWAPLALDLYRAPAPDGGQIGLAVDMGPDLALRAALVEAELRFRRFFNDAPVGIAVIDRVGRVVEANAAFAGLVVGEREPQTVIGRVFRDLVHGEDRKDLVASLAGSDEAAFGAPTEIRFKGAKERVAQLYASRQGRGEDALGLVFLLDTTEQKTLELQFAQSQKMQAVGQLAGGIAHDFNNLLTAIIGFSDLLLMRHTAGDQSFADIMQIKQNANRAANLVRQLLAFSRQQTLRPKVLDVTDVLAELSNLLRRLIGENIELRMVHGRDLGLVRVDPGQLDQVIINLAVNARDAMAGGGVLLIRTANVGAGEVAALGHPLMPAADYVLVEVSDTGHGIAQENLGKIFEPFFTTKEVGAGTGLGLSTVYGIVKQTGGFIFPESDPGKGATFRIYLPRHVPQAGVQESAAGEGGEREGGRDLTGKGTILLVEDEDAVRIFAARALRNKGYTVLEAPSGEDALDIVRGHEGPIDLLISDVVMPNMDGPTLIRHARGHRADMKIIFISGYAEEAFRRGHEPAGPFGFLPKPFSLKQLAGKVKEAIGGG